MSSKRSELADILRALADYIDNHPDENLMPLFERAATLTQSRGSEKRPTNSKWIFDARAIAAQLQVLKSREDGESLLREKIPNKRGLEEFARFLQLPVQRDDTTERLRAKIIENTIGSRLRSEAIQGKSR